MPNFDIIIVGAGHNGLVAACYLAKAGMKTLVLERRNIVGGTFVTEEIHPGFRCSTLAHSAGPMFPSIVSDLDLKRFGLQTINPEARVLALSADGRSICIYNDVARTCDEIRPFSQKDADAYPEFTRSFARIGQVLAPLATMRSEERRVGQECRSRCDWSSDVCSSDLCDEIRPFSQKDADAYPEFTRSFARIGQVLAPLATM